MAKETGIRLEGTIVEVLGNAMFRAKLESGDLIVAHISGKIRKHDIKILLGDAVEMEFSPYDLTKGRIVRRK